MTDPTPWSEDEDAGELTRELLRAAQASKLPDAERRALWAGIALSLPVPAPAPPPAASPPGLAASSSFAAYLTKGAVFLAALGGLSWGVARVWHSSQPERVATATDVMPAKAALPETAAPLVSEAIVAGAVPSVTSSDSKPRPAAASQLREESLALLEARSALRSGDAARSLSLLEQARGRFFRGALGQEREALTIEALSKSGQAEAARSRAARFIRAYPNSPYAADVRRSAGP